MKNKKVKLLLLSILLFIGIILVCFGVFTSVMENVDPRMNGILYGLGAGLIGASIAQIGTIRIYTKNPDLLHKKTIEVKDERNTTLRNGAKSKVFNLFNIILPITILVFVILDTSFIFAGILVGLYVLRFVLYLLYFNKLNKVI